MIRGRSDELSSLKLYFQILNPLGHKFVHSRGDSLAFNEEMLVTA